MRDWINLLLVITFSLVLAACGGDGLGTSGTTAQDPPPVADPDAPVPTSDATNITLWADSLVMPSDGSSTVTLTAMAQDSGSRYVQDTTIDFSIVAGSGSGGILADNPAVTDAAGRVSATLDVAGNPANRTILVAATDTATGQSDTLLVEVTGTQFAFSGPTRIEVDESADLEVKLVDAGGKPIAFQAITLTSSLGNTIQVQPPNGLITDSTGRVFVTVLAAVAGSGLDVITADALGLNADNNEFSLEIVAADAVLFYFESPADNAEIALDGSAGFRTCLTDSAAAVAAGTTLQISSTRGTFSNGGSVATYISDGVTDCWNDTLSSQGAGFAQVLAATTNNTTAAYHGLSISKLIEFISTSVSSVNVQAEKSVIKSQEQTQIIATLRDHNDNLVKNRAVSFTIVEDASNGNLNPPVATTDSNGQATVVYTAGAASSGLGDVVIRAQDQFSGVSSTAELTVRSRALHVALGTGNTMANYDDGSLTSYALPYSAIVTDSSGQPVANQTISLSIWSHRYYKGSYYPTYSPTGGFLFYSSAPVDEYQPWNVPYDGVINWGRVVGCDNEDTDLNGIAHFNEDLNRDGVFNRINEDLNDNGIIDLSEDTDGDGILDILEDVNRNGILDPGEDLNGNGKLDATEDINLNGVLDGSEDANDNGVLDVLEDTLRHNGRLDPGEDLNLNGVLDPGEDIPRYNGRLDPTEDLNDNGILDPGEDLNDNGMLDLAEDLNANGVLDATEDLDGDGFLTSEDINRNGILDPGEDTNGDSFLTTEDLNGNGVLDVSEDLNLNGLLDLGEDLNGNGTIDVSEDRNLNGVLDVLRDLNGVALPYLSEDVNNNGVLDVDEDLNGNGLFDTYEDVGLTSEDVDNDGVLDVGEDLNGNGLLDTYEGSSQNGILDLDPALNPDPAIDPVNGEDRNGNRVLDLPVDVDVNVNGRLDPGNIATISVGDTIAAFSINTTTDENGVATFAIIYPENYANWLEVSLTASVIVDGTEDSARVRRLLPALADDLNQEDTPPAGYTSPFGRGYDARTGLIQGCTVDEI